MNRRHGWLVAFAWTALPSVAWGAVGDRNGPFGVDGSIRTILAATDNYAAPALFGPGNRSDGIGQGILRLVVGGQPIDWLSYELHEVNTLTLETSTASAGSGFGGGLFSSQGGKTAYRLDPLRVTRPKGESDATATAELDRVSVKLKTSSFDATIGRQAITFGKAYFWNPLDVFFAFGSLQLDRDYKPGVDAVRLDVPISDFSGVTLVGSMGDVHGKDPYARAAFIGRAYTTVADWDVTIEGGKRQDGYLVGAGFSGEIATVEVRGEGAQFFNDGEPERERPFIGVLGLGRRFESTLHLQVEHLYNGGARPDLAESFALVAAGRLQQATRNVTGVVASYELLPVLTGSVALLFAWTDRSFAVQPGLAYSAADEVDLVAGALFAFGERPQGTALRSELGTYPDFYYVEAKIYF